MSVAKMLQDAQLVGKPWRSADGPFDDRLLEAILLVLANDGPSKRIHITCSINMRIDGGAEILPVGQARWARAQPELSREDQRLNRALRNLNHRGLIRFRRDLTWPSWDLTSDARAALKEGAR